MEHEPMNVMLNPHGVELLRVLHDRHPELSPAEILEAALAESLEREGEPSAPRMRSREELRAWLDELASLSDRIPPRPNLLPRNDLSGSCLVPVAAHLIDTNILLRIARRDDPDHAVVDMALARLAEGDTVL